jgi:hypothetical protein
MVVPTLGNLLVSMTIVRQACRLGLGSEGGQDSR